jgi:hypothetical protein
LGPLDCGPDAHPLRYQLICAYVDKQRLEVQKMTHSQMRKNKHDILPILDVVRKESEKNLKNLKSV